MNNTQITSEQIKKKNLDVLEEYIGYARETKNGKFLQDLKRFRYYERKELSSPILNYARNNKHSVIWIHKDSPTSYRVVE